MKNLFVIITVIFMSLFTSCSKEEMMNSTEESNRVCIFAELPKDAAATRAQIGIPATHKLRCIIEVWTKEDSPVLVHREEVAVEAGAIPPFEFALKSGDYNCLMWADFIKKEAGTTPVTSEGVTYDHFEEIYYRTDDLHAVTIIDENAENLFDTDLCDAFFAQLELKKEESGVSEQLKLARPFAQLIVKEKDATKFGELKKMRAIYDVPKGFNVAMSEPTSETMSAVYEKTFEEDDKSQILFTNYIFAPSATSGKALGTMALSFTTNSKVNCEIAAGSVIIKRNEKANASGNLITEGTIDPDPEPEPGDLQVGDYFFKDGTWGAELTEENKGNCVGIVYAIGDQAGDNIGNYGVNAAGKTIAGYVMALKNIVTSSMGLTNNVHSVSGRPYLYKHNEGTKTVEEGIVLFESVSPDKKSHAGYAKTNDLLSSTQFVGHSTDWSYPALQVLTTWKANTAPAVENASEWYIPSVAQLYAAAGGCYGVESISGYPAVEKITALNTTINEAIASGIAEAFTGNAGGYFVYTSCLNNQTATGTGPCLVQINKDGTVIKPKENDAKGAQGVIRPVFTILK